MTTSKLTPSSAAQWRSIGQYTAAQAASLLLGMEPDDSPSPKATALAARIAERFNLRPPGPVIRRKGDPTPPRRTHINFDELERFAYGAELTDSPLFGKAAADDAPAEPAKKAGGGRKPAATYPGMFQALGRVLANSPAGLLADEKAFTEEVLNAFEEISPDQSAHSHFPRWIKAFLDEYNAQDP